MTANIEIISRVKVAGGELKRCKHASKSTGTDMTFAIFLPPSATEKKPHVLYWLSGLTCTDENFCQKAGAFNKAAELGLCIVCPDTSPRGTDLPNEHDSYDFGSGAGFYVNATQVPWSKNYNMYGYVVEDLPKIIEHHFDVSHKRSISGHSMGGHGALTIGVKNANSYASISAFSPIVNPIESPWGKKAFSAYLGKDESNWAEYDACEILKHYGAINQTLLVDQGSADNFLAEQLLTKNLVNVCEELGQPSEINFHDGYDHSFYFISSFIEKHLAFHHSALQEE